MDSLLHKIIVIGLSSRSVVWTPRSSNHLYLRERVKDSSQKMVVGLQSSNVQSTKALMADLKKHKNSHTKFVKMIEKYY